MRALGENLKNEPGPVEDLGVPGLFEVALLDRAQRMVDDGDSHILRLDDACDFLNLSGAQKRRGPRLRKRNQTAETNIEADGPGEAGRFRKALGA